ncbi:transposase [Atopobium sp. oral taxon 416]|nr:transposase [Atopobium sp. oral taxon 416]
MVDATHLKVRVDHRICPMALMIAMGMTRDKMKELIGFRLKACESRKTWGEVPLLAARPRAFGLKHVHLRRLRGARVLSCRRSTPTCPGSAFRRTSRATSPTRPPSGCGRAFA